MNIKIVNNIPCGTLKIQLLSNYKPLIPSTNLELYFWYAFEEDYLFIKMRGSITSMLYLKKKFEIDNPLTHIEFL